MAKQKRKTFSLGGDESAAANAAPETPELEIGRMLAQRRCSLGYDLGDVAAHLCIRKTYLIAIEEGRFDQLPGPAYTNGFLRTYAELLGFDAPAVVQQYRQALSSSRSPKADPPLSRRLAENRLPGAMVLTIAMLLAAVLYSGWYVVTMRRPERPLAVPPLPDRLAAALPHPDAPTVAAPAASVEPSTPAASSRVLLRAVGDNWIQVRDGNGVLLKTSTLHAGEQYTVPDVPGVTLLTSDAGALVVEVDGTALPPLGPQGEAMHDISLNPEDLLKRRH